MFSVVCFMSCAVHVSRLGAVDSSYLLPLPLALPQIMFSPRTKSAVNRSDDFAQFLFVNEDGCTLGSPLAHLNCRSFKRPATNMELQCRDQAEVPVVCCLNCGSILSAIFAGGHWCVQTGTLAQATARLFGLVFFGCPDPARLFGFAFFGCPDPARVFGFDAKKRRAGPDPTLVEPLPLFHHEHGLACDQRD